MCNVHSVFMLEPLLLLEMLLLLLPPVYVCVRVCVCGADYLRISVSH